jgi:hypothetical protein
VVGALQKWIDVAQEKWSGFGLVIVVTHLLVALHYITLR